MSLWKLPAIWKSLTRSVYSQRMFSSLRSLWAMPAEEHFVTVTMSLLWQIKGKKKNTLLFSLVFGSWLDADLPFVCKKSRAWAMSLTTLLASSSSKCFRFWMCVRMEPEGREDNHLWQSFGKRICRCSCWVIHLFLPPRSFSNTK